MRKITITMMKPIASVAYITTISGIVQDSLGCMLAMPRRYATGVPNTARARLAARSRLDA